MFYFSKIKNVKTKHFTSTMLPPGKIGKTRQAETAFNAIRRAKAPLSEKSVKLSITFGQEIRAKLFGRIVMTSLHPDVL